MLKKQTYDDSTVRQNQMKCLITEQNINSSWSCTQTFGPEGRFFLFPESCLLIYIHYNTYFKGSTEEQNTKQNKPKAN